MLIALSLKIWTKKATVNLDINFFILFYFNDVYKNMYNLIKNRFLI